ITMLLGTAAIGVGMLAAIGTGPCRPAWLIDRRERRPPGKFGGSKAVKRRGPTRQSSTESHTAEGRTGICVAFPRLTEIGEQAVAAVAASLARGGPVIKGQLIASRFYEAMQRELRQLPIHDPKRAALIAASERCERIAAAKINPNALLDELRMA